MARPQEEKLIPAIKTPEGIYSGQQNHAEIRQAQARLKVDAITDAEHGFLYKGEFIDRGKAAEIFKQITGKDPAKPGELHSEDLTAADINPSPASIPKPDWQVIVHREQHTVVSLPVFKSLTSRQEGNPRPLSNHSVQRAMTYRTFPNYLKSLILGRNR